MAPKSAKAPPKSEDKKTSLYVIGVGASAGGLEAIQDMLLHLGNDPSNYCLIIAQHLSPTYKSMLVELLSRKTSLQVGKVEDGQLPEAGKVYITPPDTQIRMQQGRLRLSPPEDNAGPKPSVDIFFTSLAKDRGPLAVGIILSGTGSDGSQGVSEIKRHGGYVIVQEPETAKYNGMPLASIQSGQADAVLPPDRIGEELTEYLNSPQITAVIDPTTDEPSELDRLFRILEEHQGTDFSNYKPSTICRRLDKRMDALGIKRLADYIKRVEEVPDELEKLFHQILIGVTEFFRDVTAFEAIEEQLKTLLASKNAKDPIRVWVPGCATGEEAFSLAILLDQMLSPMQSRQLQIFATDVDDRAITVARKGVYPRQAVANVPKEIISKYFLVKGNSVEVIKGLRQHILFSKHDLTSNPPFLRIDLISCRNLLIYFSAGLQRQVIPTFHYALRGQGILFLGKSETVGQFTDLFSTLDGKHKIYQRKPTSFVSPVKLGKYKASYQSARSAEKSTHPSERVEPDMQQLILQGVYDAMALPAVITNSDMEVVEIRGQVNQFMSLPEGAMNANFIKLLAEPLRIDGRAVLSKAIKHKDTFRSEWRKVKIDTKLFRIRLQSVPLGTALKNSELVMVLIHNEEVPVIKGEKESQPTEEVEDVRILELEQELATTREHLQTFVEELETSNEELQSLNEELQSSNEELQSSNEELETSNEELQSTNEEMQITYAELRQVNEKLAEKEMDLQATNASLEALLSNTMQSFVLINREFNVVKFNEKAVQDSVLLTGKPIVAGSNMMSYIKPANLELFHHDFGKALEGQTVYGEKRIVAADNTEQWFAYTYTPVKHGNEPVNQVSYSTLNITKTKQAARELEENRKLIESVFNTAKVGICLTDSAGRFTMVNDHYLAIYGYTEDEVVGQPFTMMVPPEYQAKAQEIHDEFIQTGLEMDQEWNVVRKDGTLINIFVTASLLQLRSGERLKLTTISDISDMRRYHDLLYNTRQAASVAVWDYEVNTERIDWTPECLSMLGLDPEGTYHGLEPLQQAAGQAEKSKLQEAIDLILHQGVPYDNQVPLEGGKWIRLTMQPIRVHNRTIRVYGTVQDITKVRESEQMLDRITRLVSMSDNSVAILDAKLGLAYCNDSFQEIFGLKSAKAAQGKRLKELLPKGLGTKVSDIVAAAEAGHKTSAQLQLGTKAKPRWLSVMVEPFQLRDKTSNVLISATDITGLKKQQEELDSSRAWFQELFDNALDSTLVTAGEKVQFLNPAAMTMLGISEQQAADLSLQDILGEEVAANLKEASKVKGASSERLEVALPDKKELSTLEVNWSKFTVKRKPFVIYQIRDITQRLEAARKLEAKNKELEKINQELDYFVYAASHDLRSPLVSILGLVDITQEEEDRDTVNHYLSLMKDRVVRLDGFIREIIDHSRNNRTEVACEEVNLRTLVREVLDDQQQLWQATAMDIDMKVAMPVEVLSDAQRLRVLFTNLISNAIRYRNPQQAHPYLGISTEVRSKKLIIRVEDNGIGIAEKHQERVYDMFYRATDRNNGSGLGLYIVSETLRKLGGKITMDSTEGKGTTFELTIPVKLPEKLR